MILTGIVALMQHQYGEEMYKRKDVDYIQERVVSEMFIDWMSGLDNLIYVDGGYLRARKTDCSGFYAKYGEILGFWNAYSFSLRNNSYLIWKLGEEKKIEYTERGDWVYFNHKTRSHIATSLGGFDGKRLEILDFVSGSKPKARYISLYKCSGGWNKETRCYKVKGETYHIYIATNGFYEEIQKQNRVLEETRYVLYNILLGNGLKIISNRTPIYGYPYTCYQSIEYEPR